MGKRPKTTFFLGLTGFLGAALVNAKIAHQKILVQKKKDLESNMEKLINGKDSPGSFQRLVPALRKFKEAIEPRKDLSFIMPKYPNSSLFSIPTTMKELSLFAKDSRAADICSTLAFAIQHLGFEPAKDVLRSETESLMIAFEEVIKDEFPRAVSEIIQALKKNESLRDLAELFQAFVKALQGEDRGLITQKKHELMHIISCLDKAGNAKEACRSFKILIHLTVYIKDMEDVNLGSAITALSDAIANSLKKQFSLAAQEVTQDLREHESLAGLATPFEEFARAVTLDVKKLDTHFGLPAVIESLNSATHENHPHEILSHLTSAIKKLERMGEDESKALATRALKEAIEKTKKDIEEHSKKRSPRLGLDSQ